MLHKLSVLFKQFKERRIEKNLFYYLIGAIGFLEAIYGITVFFDFTPFQEKQIGWSALILCLTGIPIVVIATWFHGKKGKDPVTKVEIILITFCILTGGYFTIQKITMPHPITIMIRMMDPNEKWFKKHIIEKFEEENNCQVIIKRFGANHEVVETLKNESQKIKAGNISLVKISMPLTRVLYTEGFVRPIEDIMITDDKDHSFKLNRIQEEYDPLALKMCSYKKITEARMKLYYLPRKLETRVMIFRKSKVADAVKNWRKFEPHLNKFLREENGYGLPLNFHLDSDVNKWDYYDLLVAAYYWANTEYNGKSAAKIAHRSRDYEGTVLGLIDRALQLGANEEDVQDMYFFSDGIIDLFHWEAIFRKYGLYSEGMWDEDGWSGADIHMGIKKNCVYLGWMHQLDCALIHGVKEFLNEGYIDDKEDLGVSKMPFGVSFELTKDGIPKRLGTRKSHTYGWFWGIPKNAPEPKLAYKLAKFITNRSIHYNECEKFLLIPIRKDVAAELDEVLKSGWKSIIYEKSKEQLSLNEYNLVPRFKTLNEYQEILRRYYHAFEEIVIKRRYSREGHNSTVDRDFIREHLKD